MYRIPILSFILIITLVLVFGCSSQGSNNINPITPDQNTIQPERSSSASSASDPTLDENYWGSLVTMNSETWIAHFNSRGMVQRAMGPGVQESTNPLEVIDKHPEIFKVSSKDVMPDIDQVHGGIRYVIMRQTYKGIQVYPSRIDFRYGKTGKLVLVGADVYPDVNMNTNPTFPLDSAKRIVASEVGANETFEKSELQIYVTEGNSYNLAWRIDSGNWTYWLDATNGYVLNREHHEWNDFTGHIAGTASQPDPMLSEVPVTMNNLELRMRVDPNDQYPTYAMPITNFNGDYSYNDNGLHSVLDTEVRFYGPYCNVNNQQNFPNNEGVIRNNTSDNVPATFNFTDSNSIRSERTGWAWTNKTHDYLKSIDPDFNYLDFVVQCNVNNDPLCNAMASESSINFYQAADGCVDTGTVPDVIVHEYGHVATFQVYGNNQPDGSIHEGFSDVLGNLMIQSHYIGYNIMGNGTAFRDSKNNYKWPLDECGGEGHCLGQLLAGAYWDMYEHFGQNYTTYLYLFSRYGLPQTFQECAAEVVLVDDDDDNINNGSPNYDTIYECFFTNHNIAVPGRPNLQTQGMIVDVTPKNPEIHIGQGGGNLSFDLRVTNLNSVSNQFQIWATVQSVAGGWSYGPMIPPSYLKHAPYTLTFTGNQVLNITLTQRVPGGLPAGAYKYHIKVGAFGGTIQDDGWFDVFVDP